MVDLAPAGTPPLEFPPGARVVYRARPDLGTWGQARAEGLRHARGEIVAFI